jgi:hypothetical protein
MGGTLSDMHDDPFLTEPDVGYCIKLFTYIRYSTPDLLLSMSMFMYLSVFMLKGQ